MNEVPTYLFKTFLIGKKGVGKSTFVKSPYFSGFDDDNGLTTGVYFRLYDYSVNSSNKNEFGRFSVWVYNPESLFKEMFSNYLTGSQAIFIMFDVSDLTSLNGIDSWMEVIRKRFPKYNVPIMLLGNKADLTDHLEPAKVLAHSLVKKHSLMGYYEISALKSINVELTFRTMTEFILKKLS